MSAQFSLNVRCNVEIVIGFLNQSSGSDRGGTTCMQVFYYGNTGFGTEDLLCMLLIGCMLLLP